MIPAAALPHMLERRQDDVYERLEPLVRELRGAVAGVPGVVLRAEWLPARLVLVVEIYDVGDVGVQILARVLARLRTCAVRQKPDRWEAVVPGATRRQVLEHSGPIDRQGSEVSIRRLGDPVSRMVSAPLAHPDAEEITVEEARRRGREGQALVAANANDPAIRDAWAAGRAVYDVYGPGGRLGS